MMSSCVSFRGRGRGLVSCALAATVAVSAILASVGDAEARSKKRKVPRAAQPVAASTFTGAPNYAALVVDAKTGRVLYEKNADAIRFPASVTKVMTLYLVFEDLERQRITLDTPLTMSARCAAEAPSKLGLRPGQTITAENAIKSLVTKSANDVACAVAENLGGSVNGFAERMTAKARALGMHDSVYRNASGLPNPSHVTTARDLVILGRAIQDRFPRYYGYFGTKVFNYAGRSMPNHNRLLGRVEGIDGIKTGYTNASGFNLLSSVKSNGRSIVAVVMGGRTGASRDAHMRELIALNLPKASTGSRTAPLVAESGERSPVRPRPAVVAAVPMPLAAPIQAPVERVALAEIPTPPAPPAQPRVLAAAPAPEAAPAAAAPEPVRAAATTTPQPAPRTVSEDSRPAVASSGPTTTPQSLRWVVGAQPTTTGSVSAPSVPEMPAQASAYAEEEPTRVASLPRERQTVSRAAAAEPQPTRKGWLIQIGATTEAEKAQALLSDAKSKGGRMLTAAEGFTEVYSKGSTTYYRARFAGLNERSADAACKALKRSSMSCFAIKN
jgi:D-alanyl-D-alanine carboxypeptidase